MHGGRLRAGLISQPTASVNMRRAAIRSRRHAMLCFTTSALRLWAGDCIRQYETSSDSEPSPRHAVFHHFCFASVGRRDTNGQFVNREKFYDLSPDFYREYQSRVASYLCDVAKDVFNQA
jgi:hypothetical protein